MIQKEKWPPTCQATAKHLFLSRTCSIGSSAPFKILPNTKLGVIPWELPVGRGTCADGDWQGSFLCHRRRIAWVKPEEFRPQRYLCLGLAHHPLPLSNHAFFLGGGATVPSGPGPPHSRGFYITQRRATVGRTPLDEWSARRRDLYLTTHNTHNRQITMPPNPQSQQASGRRPTP
jgi:hypothetical protein